MLKRWPASGKGIPAQRRREARDKILLLVGESVAALIAALEQSPTEAAAGRPDPLGPGVLFLHNDLTPCWRAAAAWALGRIGDARAAPALLKVVADLDNATDTRHAAAEALGRIADRTSLSAARKLAEDYPEISVRRALREACRAMETGSRNVAQRGN